MTALGVEEVGILDSSAVGCSVNAFDQGGTLNKDSVSPLGNDFDSRQSNPTLNCSVNW